jgi:beta-lactamase regulating signal transducer with metallopeptidase domain
MSTQLWLNALSEFVSYCMQLVVAVSAVSIVCALIKSPRVRGQAWGALLIFAVARWLQCFVSATAGMSGKPSVFRIDEWTSSPRLFSVPVGPTWLSGLAMVAWWALRLYIFGLIVSLGQLTWSWLRLRSLLRRGQLPSLAQRRLFQAVCGEMMVHRSRLILVSGLPCPAAAGWLSPVVILPAENATELSTIELCHILRHELMHVKRNDYLCDLLASVACRITFFHPVGWLARRRLRWERELACDRAASGECDELRLQYAECLTLLARRRLTLGNRPEQGIGLGTSKTLLSARVQALLDDRSRSSMLGKLMRVSFSTIVIGFFLYVLPVIGLSLYSTNQITTASTQVKGRGAFRRSSSHRRGSGSSLVSQSSHPNSVQDRPKNQASAVSAIFSGLTSTPLPVLADPSGTEVNRSSDSGLGPETASHQGTWDELPGGASAPTILQKLTSDAISLGVGTLSRGQGPTEGKEGHDGR